ncbi:MAG: helix-turn-helix domain-containing protein [Acidimicrobiia bacterium]|nr:helix-turn-helix domain-containing protein [Acidimicrobiia bacterium]
MTRTAIDPLVLGHRLRYARRQTGLTLAQLGERVGRSAPYLSQLENGKVEPKLGLLDDLAAALDVGVAELLDPAPPPDRRSQLEIRLAHAQQDPRYRSLGLDDLRISAKVSVEVLEHLVGLFDALPSATDDVDDGARRQRAGDRARLANIALRREMTERNNYFPDIEVEATKALAAVGYSGRGPLSERLLTDLVAHYGFSVERVRGMPRTARSITDRDRRIIYIPQRDDLKVRAARSVVLQTLGHFALDHTDTTDFGEYLRQRIESNYFAAAILAPEEPALELLAAEKADGDLSIEDLKERFYISYEMAAHRFTNLATEKLEIPVHFLRTDPDGVITKGYQNDGIDFPTDADGALEGERVSRQWGARQAWNSNEDFLLHYQYTDTDHGAFWCVTYIENLSDRTPYAVTLGTTEPYARYFRGRETIRRLFAAPHDAPPDPALVERWEDVAWPSAAERSHVLTALPPSEREFSPFPGVDLVDVYRFLDRQRPGLG